MIGITGATGTLGSALSTMWPEEDQSHFSGDIRDYNAVLEWVESVRPRCVLHLAAIVPVAQVEADPKAAFAVNVQGTVNLCEAVGRAIAGEGRTPPWVFLASTSHVYSPTTGVLGEDALLSPLSLYGRTKWMAEQVVAAWGIHYGFPICIGRIFSYTSPRQSSDFLIPSLIRRIRAAPVGSEIRLRGAFQTRDFLTASEVATGIRLLADHAATDVYNIGSGVGLQIGAIAQAIADQMGRADVRFYPEDRHDGALVAKIQKIATLGFRAGTGVSRLFDGLVGKG